MNPKNIAIIAVAAVVIAGCLVVSFLNEDDGGQPHMVRGSELGDTFTYLVTYEYSDGETVNCIETLEIVGQDADGNQLVRWTDDMGYLDRFWCDGAYTKLQDYSGGQSVETVTVDSPLYGTVECDLHTYGNGYEVLTVSGTGWYVGDINRSDDSVVTSLLMDTTTFSEDIPELPEGGCTVSHDVSAGDFYAYKMDYYTSDGGYLSTDCLVYIAHSVEDGVVTCGWTYEEATVQCAPEEFPTGYIIDASDGEGMYIVSTVYGDVLCRLVTTELDTHVEHLLVGADGVVYGGRMDMDSVYADMLLVGSSLLAGPQADPSRDWGQQEAGDRQGGVVFYTGITESGHYSETVISEVLGDGMYGFIDYLDWRFIQEAQDVLGDIDGEPIGKETVATPYGFVECDVYSMTVDGAPSTYWLGPGGIPVKSVHDYGDMVLHIFMFETSMLDPEPPEYGSCYVRAPQVGDVSEYTVSVDGGPETTASSTVIAIDGDLVTLTDGMVTRAVPSADVYGYVAGETSVHDGKVVIRTVYGLRMCDVYVEDYGDSIATHYVGAWDGVEYRVVVEADGTVREFNLSHMSCVY